MAITIIERPREYAYTGDSPAVAVYSVWNAVWNPIVYKFSVLSSDILSSLVLNIYEIGTNTLLASNNLRPFRTGDWNVDISQYIRGYLFSEYNTDFSTADNCRDLGNRLNFYITYTQIFDNGDASIFNSEQTKPITVICAAMQFGDVHGGNMIEYVPFGVDLPEQSKAKFLTTFETPVMFAGYPFTLSFIYSLDIQSIQIIKDEVQQDVNDSALETDSINLSPLEIGQVNYLKINQPSNQFTKSILVSLRTEGEVVDNLYVDSGYVDSGYTQIN